MYLVLLTWSKALQYGNNLNNELWTSFKDTLHTFKVDPHLVIIHLMIILLGENKTLGKLGVWPDTCDEAVSTNKSHSSNAV